MKSQTSERSSPTPPSAKRNQISTQKFNQAIQQRLKQKINENETSHQSTQSVSSSQAGRDKQHFFLDQRLKNFHKVLTESLQRHSFTQKPRIDQRQSLAKLFENQRQSFLHSTKKAKEVPRTQVLSVALSQTNLREATYSPKSIPKRNASILFSQINNLLQRTDSKVDLSPPNSKRILRGSLFQSIRKETQPSVKFDVNVKDQLNTILKRVQAQFQAHEQERIKWKQEKDMLTEKLKALEGELLKSYIHIEEPTEVDFNDQSFGL